jgi:ribulose-5-phosphate 4-epimerase/fuculose-1-phosphate aldolase
MKSVASVVPSVNMSNEEWQVRQDLACCYRAFVHYGWTDLIFTHLSARVPGHDDQYIINPYGLLFHEITASNLIKVDFDGNVLEGDYPYNDAGHSIHTAILKARADVNVVLHSHTRAGMAVSCMEEGLLPLTQQANETKPILCSHKYGVATDNEEECLALGHSLGDKWAMLMQNHGLMSAGRSVGEAFYFLYSLENACKVQVDVMASGAKTVFPDDSVIAELNKYGMPPKDAPADFVNMSWDAVVRLMDQKDRSYRD